MAPGHLPTLPYLALAEIESHCPHRYDYDCYHLSRGIHKVQYYPHGDRPKPDDGCNEVVIEFRPGCIFFHRRLLRCRPSALMGIVAPKATGPKQLFSLDNPAEWHRDRPGAMVMALHGHDRRPGAMAMALHGHDRRPPLVMATQSCGHGTRLWPCHPPE